MITISKSLIGGILIIYKAIYAMLLFVNVLSCYLAANTMISSTLFFLILAAITIGVVAMARVSFISLFSVFLFYPVLSVFYQSIYHHSYGILELVSKRNILPLYTKTFYMSYSIAISVVLLVVIFTDFLIKEAAVFQKKIAMNTLSYTSFSIAAMLTALIAFPTIPFQYNSEMRFHALLPGNSWNMLTIILLLFIIRSKQQYLIGKISIIFVSFWFLSHFERVDIIGFFLCFLSLFLIHKRGKWTIQSILVFSFMIPSFLMVSAIIGESRTGNQLTSGGFLKKILVQNTATDVAYVYNITIDYIKSHGYFYITGFFQMIHDIFHNIFGGQRFTAILDANYAFPGGNYFLTPGYSFLGYTGIVIYTSLFFLFLYGVLFFDNGFMQMVYIFLLSYIPRIVWYGVDFTYTGLQLYIPVLYLVLKFLNTETPFSKFPVKGSRHE